MSAALEAPMGGGGSPLFSLTPAVWHPVRNLIKREVWLIIMSTWIVAHGSTSSMRAVTGGAQGAPDRRAENTHVC
jgi:hypothetical protein